jgi:hypothetical protein
MCKLCSFTKLFCADCTRAEICTPVRLLLPVSAVLLPAPFFLHPYLSSVYTIPLFYLLASYFVFINFPTIPQKLHEKPIYLGDLDMEHGTNSFRIIYTFVMSFILSLLFAGIAEYSIIKGIRDKPVVEVLGTLGGCFSIYMKAQDTVGKQLLQLCHHMKTSQEIEIEMSNQGGIEVASSASNISTVSTEDLETGIRHESRL